MSSLKMHIAISEKLKEELNFSNLFLLGTILPDILKLLLGERQSSHFEINNTVDLNKFKYMQKNLKSDLVLGYYSHLAEDKIWFESYINNKYIKLSEYSDKKLYNDYAYVDYFMYKKLNLETNDIKLKLLEALKIADIQEISLMNAKKKYTKDSIESKINEVWKDYKSTNTNYFYNPIDADEYYQIAVKKLRTDIINLKK